MVDIMTQLLNCLLVLECVPLSFTYWFNLPLKFLFSFDIVCWVACLKRPRLLTNCYAYNFRKVRLMLLSEVNCISTFSYVIHLDFPLVFALFDKLSWGKGEIMCSFEVTDNFQRKVQIRISPPLLTIIITLSSQNPIFNSLTFANKTTESSFRMIETKDKMKTVVHHKLFFIL